MSALPQTPAGGSAARSAARGAIQLEPLALFDVYADNDSLILRCNGCDKGRWLFGPPQGLTHLLRVAGRHECPGWHAARERPAGFSPGGVDLTSRGVRTGGSL